MSKTKSEAWAERIQEFKAIWSYWEAWHASLTSDEQFDLMSRMPYRDSRRALEQAKPETAERWRERWREFWAEQRARADEFQRSFVSNGVYDQAPVRADYSEARGGPFGDEVDTPEKAFDAACLAADVTAEEALARRWIPAVGSPLQGDIANILHEYRELLRTRSVLTSPGIQAPELFQKYESVSFWLGRLCERVFVRAFEPAARTGQRVRAGTEKGRVSRFGDDAQRQKRNLGWQTEIDQLCRRMSYESACKIVASRAHVKPVTVKKHTTNPNPRNKK